MSSSRYLVRGGDSLWKIAQRRLGDPMKWKEIARRNHIKNPDQIFIGQELVLPETHAFSPSHNPLPSSQFFPQHDAPISPMIANYEANSTPGRAFFFIIADEVNPFTKKYTRRVAFPIGVDDPGLVKRILNPQKYGFFPRDPGSTVSNTLHTAGNTRSNRISVSDHPFGAPRHPGKRLWVDANTLKNAGIEVVPQETLLKELEHAVASKQATLTRKINNGASAKSIANLEYSLMRHSEAIGHVIADKESLVIGHIPESAVKGAGRMATTRLLQIGSGVGFVLTAVDLKNAAVESYEQDSIKPLSRESTRQVTGWGGAWAGAAILGTAGAVVTVEGGPLAIAGGIAGGLVGGVIGFMYGPDAVAEILPEKVRSYVVSEEDR